MNIRILSFALVPALFLMASPLATAAIINFESLTPGIQTSGAFPMEAGFFIFMEPSVNGDIADIVNIGGVHGNVFEDSKSLADTTGSLITISLPGGALFNLNSIDIADLTTPVPLASACGTGFRIELTDNRPADCAVFTPGVGFTTVSPSGFQGISRLTVDLVSFDFFGQNFAVDNIDVTPVNVDATPEPSTVLLGAAGILWIAFRRKLRMRSNAIESTTGRTHCTSGQLT